MSETDLEVAIFEYVTIVLKIRTPDQRGLNPVFFIDYITGAREEHFGVASESYIKTECVFRNLVQMFKVLEGED
jgi:hypothetical protein